MKAHPTSAFVTTWDLRHYKEHFRQLGSVVCFLLGSVVAWEDTQHPLGSVGCILPDSVGP